MANFDFDLVVKIGSMALIRKHERAIDYNIFSRLARELVPGHILVSSGAAEIGRLDYMQRNDGRELKGDMENVMTSYSAQGQPLLMEMYRKYINPKYSVRQVLIEHSHFNDERKVEHIHQLLVDAANQNAIPIINYNDAVSDTENMKWELSNLKAQNGGSHVVECVDNDETAAVISNLMHAKTLVMLSSVDGIYMDYKDPSTIIGEVIGSSYKEVEEKIDQMIKGCVGASRKGAAGAAAKLKYAKQALKGGATVIIANAEHSLSQILEGEVPRTLLDIV